MLSLICFAAITAVAQSTTVAFTQGLVSHANLGKGEIITYNKEINNINATFTAKGKFQTTVGGLYTFHFYSLSQSDGEIWLEMLKNDEYVVSIYAYTASDWADAGNSVILDLKSGDTVYIKAHDAYANALYGVQGEVYTTFSGELIYESGASNPVAFSALLTKNVSLTNSAHAIFDKVLTNAGNGYNPATGEFVAPVDGTYVVNYHSLAQQGEQMWLELYKNDEYINTAYGEAPNTWADAGNSAILQLQAGDKLSVRSRAGETIYLYAQPNETYSSFSAALLSPSEHGAPTGIPGSAGGVQAFSVGLTKNAQNNKQGTTTKVVFDKVFTNTGQFDPSTGIFTAKVPGTYVFHYHALSQEDEEVWLELYHNYVYVDSLYGHATHGWAGGSNTATLELSQGDTVYIDMKDHQSTLYGATDEIYCTFSGYLLTPMNKYNPVVAK